MAEKKNMKACRGSISSKVSKDNFETNFGIICSRAIIPVLNYLFIYYF